VRRRAAALEEPGPGEGERAGAERDHRGAAGDRALQRADELRGRLVVAAARRHDDEVGVLQRLEPVRDDDLEPLPRPHRPRPRCADGELELRHALRAAVHAEDLDGDGELERRDVVVDHHGDLLELQRRGDGLERAGFCAHPSTVAHDWQEVDAK
jgi:hypothetical protein